MIAYGIDPGLTGAVACTVNGRMWDVRDVPSITVSQGTVKREVDPAGLAAIIREWRTQLGVDSELCIIERVASMPGQGVASVFSLGHSVGVIKGVMAALNIPTELVPPQTWKRTYGLGKDKDMARAEASRMYPAHAGRWNLVKHHNRAEAALLAGYAWREHA